MILKKTTLIFTRFLIKNATLTFFAFVLNSHFLFAQTVVGGFLHTADFPGTTSPSFARALTYDVSGNLFTIGKDGYLGYTGALTTSDITVYKSNATGILASRTFPSVLGFSDLPMKIITDPLKSVYMAASVNMTAAGGNDIAFAKFNNDLTSTTFSTSIAAPITATVSDDFVGDLKIDGAGFIYLAYNLGNVAGSGQNAYIRKYSPSGVVVWTYQYINTGVLDEQINSIDFIGTSLYATGFSSSTALGKENLLIKINTATGTEVWAKKYNGISSGSYSDYGVSVVTKSPAIYTLGMETVLSKNSSEIVLRKFDEVTGALTWVRYSGLTGIDKPAKTGLDATGNVYMTGTTSGGLYTYIKKFNSAGTELYTSTYVPVPGTMNITDVLIVPSGKVYFNGDSKSPPNKWYFTVAYDIAGVYEWSHVWSNTSCYPSPSDCNVVQAGGLASFSNGTRIAACYGYTYYPTSPPDDYWIVKDFAITTPRLANTSVNETALLNAALQISPNPCSDKTVVSYTLPTNCANASLSLSDLSGKELQNLPVAINATGEFALDTHELEAGMYLYSLKIDGKFFATKRMMIVR